MINSIVARVVTTRKKGIRVCTSAYHHHLDASLQASSSPTIKSSKLFSSSQQQQHHHPTTTNESALSTPSDINKAQIQLLKEANYLTKTLYRQCLKSVQLLARGNERDEIDFMERELAERDQLDDFLSSSSSSSSSNNNSSSSDNSSSNNSNSKKSKVSIMAPPVNRQNELSSRANYYKAFTREHFDGHWNLLGKHGFHLGDEGNMRHGLGYHHQHHQQHVGGGGGQEENRYMGGHHHLGGQMSPQYSSSHNQESTSTATTTINDASSDESSSSGGSSSSSGEYYMWREEQIEQFIYLITKGEEKRQWILNDYEFNDPCSNNNNIQGGGGNSGNNNNNWPEELHDRIRKFEERANLVVKEMYRRRGWIHSSDFDATAFSDDEDAFSDDEEEEL
jgi:hypothetical protein